MQTLALRSGDEDGRSEARVEARRNFFVGGKTTARFKRVCGHDDGGGGNEDSAANGSRYSSRNTACLLTATRPGRITEYEVRILPTTATWNFTHVYTINIGPGVVYS